MMIPSTYDVVIIGGGIMGSATAYYLKHADVKLEVAVVEMDPTYSRASTTLSMANGFSGHGLQQVPAVGRYLSELILNLPPILDLSCFGAKRILENSPLSEKGLV